MLVCSSGNTCTPLPLASALWSDKPPAESSRRQRSDWVARDSHTRAKNAQSRVVCFSVAVYGRQVTCPVPLLRDLIAVHVDKEDWDWGSPVLKQTGKVGSIHRL